MCKQVNVTEVETECNWLLAVTTCPYYMYEFVAAGCVCVYMRNLCSCLCVCVYVTSKPSDEILSLSSASRQHKRMSMASSHKSGSLDRERDIRGVKVAEGGWRIKAGKGQGQEGRWRGRLEKKYSVWVCERQVCSFFQSSFYMHSKNNLHVFYCSFWHLLWSLSQATKYNSVCFTCLHHCHHT